jgi:hypothetical protein
MPRRRRGNNLGQRLDQPLDAFDIIQVELPAF